MFFQFTFIFFLTLWFLWFILCLTITQEEGTMKSQTGQMKAALKAIANMKVTKTTDLAQLAALCIGIAKTALDHK